MKTMEIDFGPNFDWFDVLGKLANGEQIGIHDKSILDDKSGSWPACACGQLCTLLPRKDSTDAPEDLILQDLGVKFAEAVKYYDWKKAVNILNKIEKRSTELLQEMGVRVVLIEHPRHFERPPVCRKPKKVDTKPFASRLAEQGHGVGFRRQQA